MRLISYEPRKKLGDIVTLRFQRTSKPTAKNRKKQGRKQPNRRNGIFVHVTRARLLSSLAKFAINEGIEVCPVYQ